MSDKSISQMTDLRLNRREREILEFLGGNGGGFTTRQIALHVNRHADMRRWSQLTRQELINLQRRGLIEPMDDDKPVVWRRTKVGTEAVQQQ